MDEGFCNLEVDVNGEETFMVDKTIITQYSSKLAKVFGKSSGGSGKLKVIFHDFPGGAEGFELMLRFCYNNGKGNLSPSNLLLARCAAEYMEMNESVKNVSNLLDQTEKSVQGISYWSWSEILIALKQCQNLLVDDSSVMLEKCLDGVVGRLVSASEASPCPSSCSNDSSGIRFSCDSKSTESIKTNFTRSTWWFEDLLFLTPQMVIMLVKSMLSSKLDHYVISRFLLYYQKAKFATATTDEKCKIIEMVIDMHYEIDRSSVSFKTLFGILRVTLCLNISKCSRNKLEIMIGSQLDQVTLDNLLVPSPYGINYLYDVNLVLRFLKAFLRQGTGAVAPVRMRKVASLIDLYIAEIAPDPCLKTSKFLALATALPDSARDSCDELYHAMDMYLEVHPQLSKDERIKICCGLNYEKLSPQACLHLSKNTKFPSKSAVQALISQHRIMNYSLIFSALSVASITLNLFQHYNFAYMGAKLTKRIRLCMLEKILTFETAWFDEEKNSSGALCSRLSNEASMVKSLVADRVCLLVQTASAVTIAMIIGLVVAWKLALVMIAVQPLTILCFYTRKVLLSTLSTKFVKAQNQSTQIAVEAVYNHRIVTSFGSITKVLRLFDEAQEAPRMEARKKAWLAGIGMGSAQCLTFMCWALDFWYGGKLVEKREISSGDVFKTFFVLVSTGKVIAEAGSMTSDLAKSSTAVASVFEILDRQSLIPKAGEETNGIKLAKLSGKIELKNVDFSYPSRAKTPILRKFCLEVRPGKSVGLVGKSGCGKSTVIALIQRFYDVERGSVKVDNVDLRELDIHWYRQHTALVSQEPVIYSGSIRDNILFGKQDASENEVVEAARSANAHDFISSLKDGYETECGERGVQLSGGQKQRIAIARAILRNPIILLLDEATSALDVQSEQVVQEALDRIMVGRTTIVVAHRLNTIKELDSIAYVLEGKIVEQGSYSQLKHKRGAFFNLANHQIQT